MRASPRNTHLQSIDPSAPSKHFANITAKLPRHHSSLLFQLRSGHAPLNKHLFRIARSQTATCPQCNTAQESVHHFLLQCPAYIRQRNVLQHKLGSRANHVKNLLNDPNCVKPLLEYVALTRRLETVFGDESPPQKTKMRNNTPSQSPHYHLKLVLLSPPRPGPLIRPVTGTNICR